MQIGVKGALEEVTTITTYDDNLEYQYREGKAARHAHSCAENTIIMMVLNGCICSGERKHKVT